LPVVNNPIPRRTQQQLLTTISAAAVTARQTEFCAELLQKVLQNIAQNFGQFLQYSQSLLTMFIRLYMLLNRTAGVVAVSAGAPASGRVWLIRPATSSKIVHVTLGT